MRKIHRGGEERSSAPAGRKVNVNNSRREPQPGRSRRPKEPEEPQEKKRHPILRFLGRTIATVLCLTNIGNACREQTNRKESNF